jgi:hypothetical protein
MCRQILTSALVRRHKDTVYVAYPDRCTDLGVMKVQP